MAKKKIKYPVPSAVQLWKDAETILRCAFRLEKNDSVFEDDYAAKLLLSQVHQAVADFRKSRMESVSHGAEAGLIGRLAGVYEQVLCGEITNHDAYREAILREGACPPDEDEHPYDPSRIPNYFLLNAETIRAETGPIQAATNVVADFYNRGARQLMEYRSRIQKGDLIFQPFDGLGTYLPNYEFCGYVLTKTLGVDPELAAEISEFLKSRSASKPWMKY